MSQPLSASTPTSARQGRARRIARRLALALAVLIVVAAAVGGIAALWLRGVMKDSLPQVSGERRLPGLAAPVTVERDALGTPTIHAANRLDAVRALGFLHGQERFFQMDLMRRQAAGELAELFGPIAVKIDEEHRIHRFRDEARRIVAGLSADEKAVLDAYAEGVEGGRRSLRGQPFEYALLRVEPVPWRSEDTILNVFAMYYTLEEVDHYREASLGVMHDLLPPEVYAFLAPAGTEWDAPLVGDPVRQPPIPGPEVFDIRSDRWAPRRPLASPAALAETSPAPGSGAEPIGSNNWAVAGTHTADGHALLANDMHLGIGVPNTWYRVSLVFPDGTGERRVTGVTLPGTPLLAVGSTGRIAWGYTDSYIDWYDVVLLETDPGHPGDPEIYRTPQGPQRLQHFTERIRVKGGKEKTLDVPWTIWGPVTGKDHAGRTQVLSWIAHRPEAVNLNLLRLETARTVDEAVEIAHASGIPPENFVVADADGHIAWTIIGPVPKRVGFDGSLPTSWADGSRRWDGFLASAEVPKVVDPPSGLLWTANNRVVDGADLAKIGDGGVWLGTRARQIRDDLFALHKATPRDLQAIQLDDRALFMDRWRQVLASALTDQALEGHPRRRELKRLLATTWTGHASIDSVAYRAARAFRDTLRDQLFTALTARCREADPRFRILAMHQIEGPLWALVQARPANFLPPPYETWDDQLLAAVDIVLASWDGDLAARTWGERNTSRFRHPLSLGVPFLGRFIDMPHHPLPGDQDMPRVQSPILGASERMVVSPGHEEAGLFHMPDGESGNPLSPHYRDGLAAWENGEPTPFLPGPAVEVLRLVP